MQPDMRAADHEGAVVHEHKTGQFFWVWGILLLLTAIEVYLGYQNMQPVKMLSILLVLSFFKAALIVLFFMHMKFETARMRWVLMGSLVICLGLMSMFFADAMRIIHLGIRQ
ncbi:MAG: cytochrome C oxidase subunit IV family protein [Acidobacteria bacterium]|nr:cytochrome C oxidase subunit IV family protein [Acidobacteriaceae bacterium]MBV9609935.1 cytochrome C oxidase subunit IV family protein [Acidobacteriota bacterium]